MFKSDESVEKDNSKLISNDPIDQVVVPRPETIFKDDLNDQDNSQSDLSVSSMSSDLELSNKKDRLQNLKLEM